MTVWGGYLTRVELLRLRGSLAFARDDGAFFGRHFDQVKRVEKSPKAKRYLPTTLILSDYTPATLLSHTLV